MAESLQVLGLLLRQRGRLAWNRVRRGPRPVRRIVGLVLTLVLIATFVGVAGLNTGFVVERLARTDRVAALQVLPIILAAGVLLTLLTSLTSAFHHLFAAGDLELLLVAPVPLRSLLGLKIMEIWRDSVHVLLFEAAALYGFGQGLRLPPTYYVTAAFVGLPLALTASALGAMIALGVARLRFGGTVLVVGRILAILLFLPLGAMGVPSVSFGRGGASFLLDPGRFNLLAGRLRDAGEPPTWAPTTWAAHVMLGDDVAVLSLALLIAAATILWFGTQLAFDALYQASWERVRFSGARRRASRKRFGLSLPTIGLPHNPVLLIALKDWRSLTRDPRWRGGTLVSLLALGVPALFIALAGDSTGSTSHSTRFWLAMLPVPYLAFLLGNQQGAATLAYEGRNLALLRAAPVATRQILVAKALGGAVLVLLVTWAATLGLSFRQAGEPEEVVAAVLAATWLAIGATVSAVAGAALTADFEVDNPQRRVGCLGAIVGSGLSGFFFVANTSTFAWWAARDAFRASRLLAGLTPVVNWVLPAAALLSVVAILLAMQLGVRRLANWESS